MPEIVTVNKKSLLQHSAIQFNPIELPLPGMFGAAHGPVREGVWDVQCTHPEQAVVEITSGMWMVKRFAWIAVMSDEQFQADYVGPA